MLAHQAATHWIPIDGCSCTPMYMCNVQMFVFAHVFFVCIKKITISYQFEIPYESSISSGIE